MKYKVLTTGLLTLGGALLVLFFIIIFQVNVLIHSPMLVIPGNDIVMIDKQTTAKKFVQLLYEKHLISSPRIFLMLIRVQGVSHHLKAGIYSVHANESAQQFLYHVIDGEVLTKTFVIIEGTTQSIIQSNLRSAPYLRYNEMDWQVITPENGSVEGLLLADSYQYDAGSSASILLRRAHDRLTAMLKETWQHRDINLPYKTAYQLLIAASIIEKEAKTFDEKKLVSGVVVNRLKINMPLQMDPTIIYALQDKFSGKLSKQDLALNSLYNTYRHYGLPPTPIAMVGMESLLAAAHPTRTSYLYYVAKGDGTHEFSTDYRQQINAVHRYQQKGKQ